jgi:hypothetical protein
MSHMDWVARQNKLELPNDEEEVNTRDIHKCDGQAHDPDTMAAPLRFTRLSHTGLVVARNRLAQSRFFWKKKSKWCLCGMSGPLACCYHALGPLDHFISQPALDERSGHLDPACG